MKTLPLLSILAVSLCLAACSSDSGVPDRAIGRWQTVTTAKDKKSKGLCYAVSAPVGSEGTFTGKRGTPYLMITRLASGKEEVSVSSGYDYMKGSRVELATDDESFELKFKNSVAWARDNDEDDAIIEVIKDADSIEVRGVNKQSKTTVDAYSSVGLEAALERVEELCP